MPVVSIQNSERYYLKILLLWKLGAVSFEDIRIADEIIYDTFQQAYRMGGLLERDQHWHDILDEATLAHAPSHLRLLLSMICGVDEVEDIPKLWNKRKACSQWVLCSSLFTNHWTVIRPCWN